MEEYDSIEDLPQPAQEVVDVIIQSTYDVGIDRASIRVRIQEEDELGVAYLATRNHDFESKIVFKTDGSRRVWIVPDENV